MTINEIDAAVQTFRLLDQVPVGVCVLRDDFEVLFWNRCLEEWTRIDRKNILGTDIGVYFPHLREQKYTDRLRPIFQGGPPTIFSSQLHKHLIPAPLPTGGLRVLQTTVTALEVCGGAEFHALFTIQDVTESMTRIQAYCAMRDRAFSELEERKRAEEAVRESEERYQRITAAVTDYIFTVRIEDRRPVETVHSPACEAVTGYAPEEFASNPYLWIHMVHEQDRDAVRDQASHVLSGQDVQPLEHRIFRKDGAMRWVRNTFVPHHDAQGNLLSYDGLISDITERKRLEEQLRQAQKMEAIGQLAGGVAHDFNNLLTGIIGNLALAERKAPDEIGKYLVAASDAAGRAEKLVKQLLAFSRKSRIQLKPVDLNRIVREAHRLVRQTIDRRIEIRVRIDEGLPNVRADAVQINSILMNLCINARDAIVEVMNGRTAPERRGDQFVISIETEAAVVGGEYCESHTYARPGPFVVLSVSDNGAGMDAETQRHVFEPFFTTKQPGQGTGLGLASAYGIIKQHDGWINLYSEPGKGTTFKIYLPIAEEEIQENCNQEMEEVLGGTETILLVDDEEMIRNLGQTTLEGYGYTVFLAADGREALNIYLKQRERIHLIILDFSMPYLSGPEVLVQLHALVPDAKVILSSGYNENSRGESLERLGAAGFVAKPYRPVDLGRTVRKVLDTSQ